MKSGNDDSKKTKPQMTRAAIEMMVALSGGADHLNAMKQAQRELGAPQQQIEIVQEHKPGRDLSYDRERLADSMLEFGHGKWEESKNRRLKQLRKEAAATDAARAKGVCEKNRLQLQTKARELEKKMQDRAGEYTRNKKDILKLEKAQSETLQRKKDTEKQLKENKQDTTPKKKIERL